MANSRIKDIATTAAAAASDDYLVIDGATNGTRKIAASNVGGGGGSLYDFTSTLTPSVDSRGVSSTWCQVYPVDTNNLTMDKILQMKFYLADSSTNYPLFPVQVSPSSTRVYVVLKSLYGNPQNTTSTTVSGTLHVVSPFELSAVNQSM